MACYSTPEPLLRDLVSKLKLAENPTDFLASKLKERAQYFTHNTTEQEDEKPQRGIPCRPQVCATESDVDVSEREEREEAPKSAAAMYDSLLDYSSHVVDELLPVAKSERVVGRGAEKELLLSPDPRGPQLSVIPIVGVGGIGKTALARLIYEDRTVQEHFELKAWVEIDAQERNHQLFDIARKLLKSATGMLCSLNNVVELYEIVVDTLLSQRSLIVLDDFDFMEMELWQHLKDSWFRFVGLGSKIIILTRSRHKAEMVASSTPFYLERLSHGDSWCLYSSLASSRSKERESRMIQAAEGLPLSLKLLGSLMRFEEICSADFTERMKPFEDDSFALSISVLALPYQLFNCFAYCGIFPYGYVLEKEKLIKMWIADGVLKVNPSSVGRMDKSVEDIGEACFHQLLCRSFLTDITCNEYGDIVQARMPRVVHKLARYIAGVVLRDKIAYAFGVDANSLHLSMTLPFQGVYDPKNLQTLVLFPLQNLHLSIPNRLSFIELKRLRSLDLSKSGIRSLSKQICMLRKLRYLNLSHTLLTKLPKSFTALTRLQTLDLSRCYYLKVLPKKISNLSKLRHLDLSHCNSLCYMPSGIGSLHSLITMPLYALGEERDSKRATLKELHELNELRGVLHIRNLENVREISEARAADLKQKKLHHLGLCWSIVNECEVNECDEVLQCLEPNPQLRVLELTGYGGYRFPSWMPNLRCLVKLLINDCRCTKLPTLGHLQLLKELELKDLNKIISIGQEFYGNGGGGGDVFPSLEKLKLHGMRNLNIWSNAAIAEGSNRSSSRVLAKLKKLSIQGCPELQTLPSLPCVTELVVWRSHSEILPWMTRIESLSSIVINDMGVKEPFEGSSSLNSVKRLIVVHSTDLDVLESSHISKFTALQHLRILHCLVLEYVEFSRLGSLERLNVVDCQNLVRIDLIDEDFALTELIVEDCPQLHTIHFATCSKSSLRKLIVKNCPKFSISPRKIEELRQGLEFLFIAR